MPMGIAIVAGIYLSPIRARLHESDFLRSFLIKSSPLVVKSHSLKSIVVLRQRDLIFKECRISSAGRAPAL